MNKVSGSTTTVKCFFFCLFYCYFSFLFFWTKAKNGSIRCFFGQKRMHLKTIVAESVVGRIGLANTHCLPFLVKSDRVLPAIATLPGNSYFAQLLPVFGHFLFFSGGLLDYSNISTWAKISPR